MKNQLVNAIFELDEDLVINIVKERSARGESPIHIINEVQQGLIKVGKEYDKGRYFIADLIMAGLIFNDILKYIPFQPENSDEEPLVNVIFATVEHDIHDIGKNIANSFFQSRGVVVDDLGVDVPPEKIISRLKKDEFNILFLSGLITASFDSMKKTIKLIDAQGLRQNVKIIISGLVDEIVCEYVGADGMAKDVVESYEIYKNISSQVKNNERPVLK